MARHADILGKSAVPVKAHDLHFAAQVFGAGGTGRALAAPRSRIDIHQVAGLDPGHRRSGFGHRSHDLLPRNAGQDQIAVAHADQFEIRAAQAGDRHLDDDFMAAGFVHRRGCELKSADFGHLDTFHFHPLNLLGCFQNEKSKKKGSRWPSAAIRTLYHRIHAMLRFQSSSDLRISRTSIAFPF